MIDGIAGSGKSTVLRAIDAWAQSCEHRVFRLSDWQDLTPPKFDDIPDYDVYFTYEPTRTWIGRAIRYELSREDKPYGGEELAHAFALDRQIMYRQLVIPALRAGKTVIQDRGVSTSLVYQPIMPGGIPLEQIRALPGNKLALSHAPHALILTKLSPEEANKRMQARIDDTRGVFGNLEFMKKIAARFEEPWLKNLFEKHGTILYQLDTSGTIEDTTKRAQKMIDHILSAIPYAPQAHFPRPAHR